MKGMNCTAEGWNEFKFRAVEFRCGWEASQDSKSVEILHSSLSEQS